jgi:hypothetical protein
MPAKIRMTANLEGIESLKKLAKANQYVAKVGVLGATNQRSDADRSVGEIKENLGMPTLARFTNSAA